MYLGIQDKYPLLVGKANIDFCIETFSEGCNRVLVRTGDPGGIILHPSALEGVNPRKANQSFWRQAAGSHIQGNPPGYTDGVPPGEGPVRGFTQSRKLHDLLPVSTQEDQHGGLHS